MIAVVIILIIMVCGIQLIGDYLVNRLDKRNLRSRS
jgi:ABC-type methionine transport system permease subunit